MHGEDGLDGEPLSTHGVGELGEVLNVPERAVRHPLHEVRSVEQLPLREVDHHHPLAALATNDRPHDDVRDFAGLWHERPGLAALLTVFLLSLAGFPPTVGFIGKWYIFNAAVQENLIALAVLGVLTSVVSVFFYLRIVVMMYMTDEKAPGHRPAVPGVAAAGLIIALVAVFYLGVLPGKLLWLAAESVGSIF